MHGIEGESSGASNYLQEWTRCLFLMAQIRSSHAGLINTVVLCVRLCDVLDAYVGSVE